MDAVAVRVLKRVDHACMALAARCRVGYLAEVLPEALDARNGIRLHFGQLEDHGDRAVAVDRIKRVLTRLASQRLLRAGALEVLLGRIDRALGRRAPGLLEIETVCFRGHSKDTFLADGLCGSNFARTSRNSASMGRNSCFTSSSV